MDEREYGTPSEGFSREDELNQKLEECKRQLNAIEDAEFNRKYQNLKVRSNFLIGFAAGLGGVGLICKAVLRNAKAKHEERRKNRTYGE